MAAADLGKNVKVQVVLIGMIVVLFAVLFVFLLWSPNQTEIKAKRETLNKLQNDLTVKRALAANLERLKTEIAQLETTFKEALKKLPEDKEIPRLISQINENMTKSGLDFMLFRPATTKIKDFYSEYPIDIRVMGGYHNVGIFLDHISKMERIVNVGDVRLTAIAGAPGGGQLTVKPKPGTSLLAEFRVSTYTYAGEKEKAPAKTIPKPGEKKS
jgi:type IV pilus assembly protein PilO